ncbi:MAG TPA: beta-propeller fold lactonase family protein [Solirubrobacteraceae bacterium]|jgi:DNA-binding beta-propeller fold protein YncE|nr:beta-propeller fold lactonase family protein [Solirubrobacteraceae bacterium]
MKAMTRLSVATVAAAAVLAGASASASAFGGPHGPFPFGADQAVFVQTDNLAGNQVVTYDRAANGTLTQAGVYATGGLGGQLEGSVVDHLASQGSLAYDPQGGLLYAVNAGSDTISVFAVLGDHLALRQVLSSGGSFPVSIAVHGNLVYVLNGEDGGSLQGYVSAFGRLYPIPGSSRALGLSPTASPQFTNTPGQVAFSPDGSQLIVTTKENGSDIDVFRVFGFGQLSPTPVVNSEPGTVPFAVTFDHEGNLVVAEAAGALASFRLSAGGTVTQLDSVATDQAATCWVAAAGSWFYASNAGSGSLSRFQSGFGGALTLLGDTTTNAGTVDATVSSDARFLYAQTGAAGIVDEFAIGAGGALSEIGSVTVPSAIGGEGIVAG